MEKTKKKPIKMILIAAAIVVALVAVVLVIKIPASMGSGFDKSVEAAIEDGSITPEMEEHGGYLTDKQYKYLTKKLTEFQQNDEVGKALAVLYAFPQSTSDSYGDCNSILNGNLCFATDSFINWLKKAVVDGNEATKPYQFRWAATVPNQFEFMKKGDKRKIKVSTQIYRNGGKTFCAGLEEDVDFKDEGFYNMPPEKKKRSLPAGYKTCPTCGGGGAIKYYYGSSDTEAYLNGEDPYEYQKCYTCGGSGRVPN